MSKDLKRNEATVPLGAATRYRFMVAPRYSVGTLRCERRREASDGLVTSDLGAVAGVVHGFEAVDSREPLADGDILVPMVQMTSAVADPKPGAEGTPVDVSLMFLDRARKPLEHPGPTVRGTIDAHGKVSLDGRGLVVDATDLPDDGWARVRVAVDYPGISPVELEPLFPCRHDVDIELTASDGGALVEPMLGGVVEVRVATASAASALSLLRGESGEIHLVARNAGGVVLNTVKWKCKGSSTELPAPLNATTLRVGFTGPHKPRYAAAAREASDVELQLVAELLNDGHLLLAQSAPISVPLPTVTELWLVGDARVGKSLHVEARLSGLAAGTKLTSWIQNRADGKEYGRHHAALSDDGAITFPEVTVRKPFAGATLVPCLGLRKETWGGIAEEDVTRVLRARDPVRVREGYLSGHEVEVRDA